MVVYNAYPADTRVKRAAEALVDAGYRVHVVCTKQDGKPATEEVRGVEVHRVGLRKVSGASWKNLAATLVFLAASLAACLRLHRRNRCGIYHVHSLPDFLVFVVSWQRMRGARVVLDLHESFPEIVLARFGRLGRTRHLLARIAAFLEGASCRFSNAVIVVNDTIRDLVIKRGVPPEKVTVIMNSPVLRNQPEGPEGIHPLTQAMRARPGKLFVYAGGLNSERDMLTLLQAAAILKSAGDPLNIAVFTHTRTPFAEELHREIDQLGLRDEVRFGGSLPPEQVLANVAAGDVGIVSYVDSELTRVALPNKVFEYMEAGCPVVSADLPTLRGLLGDRAVYYRPSDARSLAQAITTCVKDPATRDSLRETARMCSWDIMRSRLLGIYGRLT